MLRASISRAAVGRSGKIGALYNATSDTFTKYSLFKQDLDADSIDVMKDEEATINIVQSNNTEEKFRALNVEEGLQMSLLADFVQLNGSGAYINNEKKSGRAQRRTLMYKVKTQEDEISLKRHKEKINNDVFMAIKSAGHEATHVVVGIEWGAVCSITCENENSEDREKTAVQEDLRVELEKFRKLLKAGDSVDSSDSRPDKASSFTFKCISDVFPVDKTLTFEEALEYAKKFPVCIQQTNGGKGVPLLFTLLPLQSVVKICSLQIDVQFNFMSIEEDTMKRTVQMAEKIKMQRQLLHDIQNDLHMLGDYIEEAVSVSIDQCVKDIAEHESSFRCKLRDLVPEIRRQNEDVSALETWVKEFTSIVSSYDSQIQRFQVNLKDFLHVKEWTAGGIRYTSKKARLSTNDATTVYIMYKPREDTKRGQQIENFFLRCHRTFKTRIDTVFKVVDEAITPDLWTSGKREAKVVLYENGIMACDDLYTRDGKNMNRCLIRRHDVKRDRKPKERAAVKLKCPKQCSGKTVIWECSVCNEVVEYGVTTRRFHCSCGSSTPANASFRCSEESHGIDYVKYSNNFLFDQLNLLRANPEKNVLILGEVGVGKSTWINAIVNYLAFDDLEDAMNASDFYTVIPSQFTHHVGGHSVTVKLGAGSKSTQIDGNPETTETMAYVFFSGEERIRLIDTPGVGVNPEEDRKSLENILSYVSFYDEIHAVCILLKSNNSRVTVPFRYCLQELLKNLHKSAKSNVVFCFTNSRASGFSPGDSVPVLNSTLKQMSLGIECSSMNYFCFENDALRFLACLQSDIPFTKKQICDFAESWQYSAEQTKNFFLKIRNMDPHQVKSTISINESRKIIVAMTKPMAEIAKVIQLNIKRATDANATINFQRQSLAETKKALRFKGITLERTNLPYPKTVCAHTNCIKRVTVGEGNTQETLYPQECHAHCNLRGVPTETINDYRLQECWCISGTQCHQCGHDFKIHMHITYTVNQVEKEFISPEVQGQILRLESKTQQQQRLKETIDDTVRELKEEERSIIKASAHYGAFLQQNAIKSYNDATGEYLDLMIRHEQEAPNEVHENVVKRLLTLKREYEAEKQIFKEAMSRGHEISSNDIWKVKIALLRLKHFGKTLKDMLDGISVSHSTEGLCYREKFAPIRQRTCISEFSAN